MRAYLQMVRRFLVGVALLAAGCTTTPSVRPSPSAPAPNPADLVPANVERVDGTWQLLTGSVGGRPVPIPAGTRTTIHFAGTEFGGQAACNAYGGRVQIAGNAIASWEIGQQLAGCQGDSLDSEQMFIHGLSGVTAIWRAGDQLVLSGPRVQFRFTRLPEVRPDEFTDRRWVLVTVVREGRATPPGGLPATLLLGKDGTLSGSTGCRTFQGMWIAGGDQIAVTAIDMGGEQCPSSLAAQDGFVVGAIGGAIPSVEGDELTLRSVSGAALVYRAVAD